MAETVFRACPFCGGTKTYYGVTEDGTNVCCYRCQASGPVAFDSDHDSDEDERLAAALAWNHRPEPAEVPR